MTAVRYPGPFFYRQSRRTSSSHSFPHDTDKLCSILTIIFFVSHINATRAIDLLPSPLSTSFLSLHVPMPNANIRLSCRNHSHILSPLSLMRGVRAYHATRTHSGLGTRRKEGESTCALRAVTRLARGRVKRPSLCSASDVNFARTLMIATRSSIRAVYAQGPISCTGRRTFLNLSSLSPFGGNAGSTPDPREVQTYHERKILPCALPRRSRWYRVG